MSEIMIVKYWDSMPPVVYDGPGVSQAYSTRVLERQWRRMEQTLEQIAKGEYTAEEAQIAASASLGWVRNTQHNPQ